MWSSNFDEWFFDESFDLVQFGGICFQTSDNKHAQQKQPSDFISLSPREAINHALSSLPLKPDCVSDLHLLNWYYGSKVPQSLHFYSNEASVAGLLMKLNEMRLKSSNSLEGYGAWGGVKGRSREGFYQSLALISTHFCIFPRLINPNAEHNRNTEGKMHN